ncbi:serine/threonine protein kinase [Streptomyces lunaelactis]|uniref:serine/threonine-protein kinase n=4 Tax=Streptomyces lunaelactis TaxID=1535768 RepID=UPI001585B55F|nr:serine/threonine-protein kinase [Streptomyces lunaelactis]NUK62158.1 serine/threonine protein kinase [Streptomyces lunaelactis]NUK65767.1 serine/threonine protein kinase [Streptomyces lunaelactis]
MEHSQSTGAGLLLAGRYRLSETIGSGGMGKVWRAHDEVLHRVVAVKELTAGRYASEADRIVLHARTQKEARAAARISHPGVVTVHDVLEHDARPWIVMQYVDGPSLADAAKESGRVPASQAARVGLHVLRALGAAHAAGVLHRDVKPANILLNRDGRALITDFGIAAIEGDSTITRTGEIVGSIDYLAPERVRGADPGPASDLWSLGATLYTAVEGESPFRRSSPLATMQAVVGEEPRHPEQAGLLTHVIMALLRKDPAARPSAAEAERMLLEAMEGRAPAVRPQPQPQVPAQRTTPHAVRPETARLPTPTPYVPLPVPGPNTVSAAGPRRGGRLRTALIVVVLAAVVGGGAGLAAMKYAGDKDNEGRTGNQSTPDPSQPGAGTGDTSQAGRPGWHRAKDPAGFSLLVPDGWTRQMDGDQIDYTPDNGRHRIRISSDTTPDFENPYTHMLDMERNLRRLPKYERLKLRPNTYRDQTQSALWEFTWTEKKDHPGPRRAIDQMYIADDGTEYALYMSGPAGDWAKTREQFDIMLQGWRPRA